MKKTLPVFIIGLILLSLVLACAPQTTPVPTPVAPSPISSTPATTSKPPAQSANPQDTYWAKVVEAARKEGKLTMYTFFFSAQAQPLVKAFEQRYPEIKVEFAPMASAVRLERLKTEQRMGNYIADTSDGAGAFQMNLRKEDLLMPIGDLPSLSDTAWQGLSQTDKEGYLVFATVIYHTFWSNTTQLKSADEPKTLKDLLDAKWKGKIIQIEPATSSIASTLYSGYVRHGKADDEYFRQLGPQWKWVTGSTLDAGRALARGEAPLAWGSTSTNNSLIVDGAPIKPLSLQEGALLAFGTAFSIVKNAPHPNAAKVFFNWLMSQEGQKAIMENQGMKSLRQDVPDMSPPAARIDWKQPVVTTLEDMEYSEQVFSSRKLVDMWGRK